MDLSISQKKRWDLPECQAKSAAEASKAERGKKPALKTLGQGLRGGLEYFKKKEVGSSGVPQAKSAAGTSKAEEGKKPQRVSQFAQSPKPRVDSKEAKLPISRHVFGKSVGPTVRRGAALDSSKGGDKVGIEPARQHDNTPTGLHSNQAKKAILRNELISSTLEPPPGAECKKGALPSLSESWIST